MIKLVKKSYAYPEGNLIFRGLDKQFPVISHGRGCELFDTAGKGYLDAVGGAYVVSVGHNNKDVLASIFSQLKNVAYVNGTQFTSGPALALAEKLAKKGKVIGLDRSSFLCSGSEAVEAAIKMARQIWVEQKKTKKFKIISRQPGYHGNTLFALSISGRPAYRKLYGPLLNPVLSTPAPSRYRFKEGDYDKVGAAYYAEILEALIQTEGADTISAFIFEPVIGSSAGGAVPPKNYFKEISKICRKNQILLIADEVLTGVGRTGKFFACEHFGIEPDILVLGKGINGGYAPLSVVMTKTKYTDMMKAGSGTFMHAQTYMHHPVSVAAGNAVLDFIDKQKLVKNSAELGKILIAELKSGLSQHPCVGNIEGIGLLASVEFVENKKSKKPFLASKKVTETVIKKAFENGLILWPNKGHVDGVNGDLVMLSPPLTVKKDELREMIGLLLRTISQVKF